MKEISSAEEFVNALGEAGDRLVVVKFYSRCCNSCRAVYPKVCKLCRTLPDVILLKVGFEANKQLCRALGVKVLPFFHFYRGADGRLDAFSASITKFQKLKDAIRTHNTPRCSLGPSPALEESVARLAMVQGERL